MMRISHHTTQIPFATSDGMLKAHEWAAEAVKASGKSGRALSRLFWKEIGRVTRDESVVSKMAKDPSDPGPKPRRVQLNDYLILSRITGHPLPKELAEAIRAQEPAVDDEALETAKRIQALPASDQGLVQDLLARLEAQAPSEER